MLRFVSASSLHAFPILTSISILENVFLMRDLKYRQNECGLICAMLAISGRLIVFE